VIQPRIAGEITKGSTKACFGVPGPEDQGFDSTVDQGTRTHGARLQGHVEGATDQSPSPDDVGGLPDREDLGVGQGIAIDLPTIVTSGDEHSTLDDDGPYGHLAEIRRFVGGFQGHVHPPAILEGLPLRIRFGRTGLSPVGISSEDGRMICHR
jgi:hypothetical protein